MALSNMPIKSKRTEDSYDIIEFERTPKMSTYLVAFVVGEYEFVERVLPDKVVVRIYTPKNKQEQGRFALDVACKILPFYNEYFGIAYPLPKLDLIGVPEFAAGAMENWGLVTFRETCILVDAENTSTIVKQNITVVIAHELAHQWFGNLVTMEWWSDLWLNEGYACFMEYLCLSELFPEYEFQSQFVMSTHINALELDGLKNSHPIEVPVYHPSEIDEIFDDISYHKSASIIRMLYFTIGKEKFREGMKLYLTTYSYANTETDDLWSSLQKVTEKPVKEMMKLWTKQQGFPVISVKQKQVGENRELALSQQRFHSDGSADVANTRWIIPVEIVREGRSDSAITIVRNEEDSYTVENIAEKAWVKLNPECIGFYRVRYDADSLSLLKPAIEKGLPSPLDRLGILNDHFAMARAGYSPTCEVLDLIRAFKTGTNYTTWACILSILHKIENLVAHLDCARHLRLLVKDLLQDSYERLGWEPKPGETHLDNLLRSMILRRLAILGDDRVIAEAKRRFELYVSGKAPLSADLRDAVYRAVLISGDATTFETMLRLYRETDLHEEQNRILASLAFVQDEKLLARSLEFILTKDVRPQDLPYAMSSYSHSSLRAKQLAWQFYQQHHETLLVRCESAFLRSQVIKFIIEDFVTVEDADEIERFFLDHPVNNLERTIQQCLENVRLNAVWLGRDQKNVVKYLEDYVSARTSSRQGDDHLRTHL